MLARLIAVLQLVLIFPASLFMTALVVRNFGPLQYEPAHAAHQLVMWYAGRLWTLWVLLFALPCVVLVVGFAALRTAIRDIGQHNSRPPPPALMRPLWPIRCISVTTVASAGILAIVISHVLAH
jgi:hypothetical protein